MHRRTFLRTGLLALGAAHACAAPSATVAEAFDAEVEKFMAERGIPGGAIAVSRNRRLVHAKGYGWADREQELPATADSLFRIASISKPFTGVAVLKLVEDGRLSLDAPAFALLGFKPAEAADPRLAQITIGHLLHHTGGWDRDKSGDPMFRAREIAKAQGVASPAQPTDIIRQMFTQPLDSDPGRRYAYSNFGFCMLGRVIEKITGQRYDEYVREKILTPCGIRGMRIGASLSAGQAAGEVRYYTVGDGRVKSVFGETAEKVPWPYGGFHLEAMDAHGGWLASATDLVRFAAALDDSALLRRETRDLLYAPPEAPVSRNSDGALAASYYGCGWSVRPVGKSGQANYWHTGSLPGTATLLVRRWDGLSWAIVFNQRSEDREKPDGAIDAALHRAADRVGAWPEGSPI